MTLMGKEKKNNEGSNEETSKRFAQKKHLIEQNHNANKTDWQGFTDTISNLIVKANNLPSDQRVPFGTLKFEKKENKFNLFTYILTGSERIEKKAFFGLLPGLKKSKFKHYRMVFLRMSSKEGYFDIELKENTLKKVKVSDQGNKNHGVDSYKDHSDRFNQNYSVNFKSIDRDLYDTILSWIAFKYPTNKVTEKLGTTGEAHKTNN